MADLEPKRSVEDIHVTVVAKMLKLVPMSSFDRRILMKFYVVWREGYDGDGMEEFSTDQEVLGYLNARAHLERFTFTVIEGREVKFEPAEVVKAYKRKS